MQRNFLQAAAALIVIGIAACGARTDTPQVGTYRAVLRLPGRDTPFGLEVAEEQRRYVLHLVNGAERTRVKNVRIADGELIAMFPGYENSLRAKLYRDKLEGSVTLIGARIARAGRGTTQRSSDTEGRGQADDLAGRATAPRLHVPGRRRQAGLTRR